jgi:hypothetical protein
MTEPYKHLRLKLCRTALGKRPYYRCENPKCPRPNFEVPEPLIIKVSYPKAACAPTAQVGEPQCK